MKASSTMKKTHTKKTLKAIKTGKTASESNMIVVENNPESGKADIEVPVP